MGGTFEISTHADPSSLCASIRMRSSSSVQLSRLMLGSSWLCQRSRHCFPLRPGRFEAIAAQRVGPYRPTRRITVSSSSFVHAPLGTARCVFCGGCAVCGDCIAGAGTARVPV